MAGRGIKAENSCEETKLNIDVPIMEYRDTNGAAHKVEREITISYHNLTADSANAKWTETDTDDSEA